MSDQPARDTSDDAVSAAGTSTDDTSRIRADAGADTEDAGRPASAATADEDSGSTVDDDTGSTVAGQGQLGPLVEAFDARCDELLERLRGNPIADRLFSTATHVGDFSLIWHAIGVVRGLSRGRPDQIIVLAVSLGIESLVVNQGVKRLFRRSRPTTSGDERLPVRTPSTSSFPSGHASSATYAATLLTRWDAGRPGLTPWASIWWSVAAVVGISRAYVRIHHASDVVGGVVVGRLLALGAWRVVRRLAPA